MERLCSPFLTLNCIILQIILCVYNLQGKHIFQKICSVNRVAPTGQLLRVDPNEAEETDNHDGDEPVKDIVPAIVCQRVVPTVRQIGQKECWKEEAQDLQSWITSRSLQNLLSAERIVATLGIKLTINKMICSDVREQL